MCHWRLLMRIPWTARRSNYSILKEVNPEYLLKGLVLKVKLQYIESPDAKSWLSRKDSNVEKDWRQEKGMTEDEMVGWHHWLDGHEQAPEVGDVQGSLACCSSQGRKELDTTEQLNWTESNYLDAIFKAFLPSVKSAYYTVLSAYLWRNVYQLPE